MRHTDRASLFHRLFIRAGGALVLVAGVLTAVPTAAQATTVAVQRSCSESTTPGVMACLALRRTDLPVQSFAAARAPSGLGPADLAAAYKLGAGGAGATVAIVDAFDDPNAEADLAVYRSTFGLPACTTANGCFRKVNQTGTASPLPKSDTGWAGEISLDVDMVSAACPSCHILLVEAGSADDDSLFIAINEAVTLGAKYVSNSWGGPEDRTQTGIDTTYLNHPGVAITFSSGDSGTGSSFPATSQFVTAVGGTSLTRSAGSARGWTETAWRSAGSGCSAFEVKPVWQTVSTTCAKRAESDVSAVADPATGVAVYQTFGASGWAVYGGTSASAPIIAAVYALAGTPGATDYPATYPYAHAGALFDVTSGKNGSCAGPVCVAGAGWDGPTGLGSPNGVAAFAAVKARSAS